MNTQYWNGLYIFCVLDCDCRQELSGIDDSLNFKCHCFIESNLYLNFCGRQQPRPLKCTSCEASGSKECVWCKGTGFFILGDSMLCEVPSRNTTCVICAGQVSLPLNVNFAVLTASLSVTFKFLGNDYIWADSVTHFSETLFSKATSRSSFKVPLM